jgi:hypothetical protein
VWSSSLDRVYSLSGRRAFSSLSSLFPSPGDVSEHAQAPLRSLLSRLGVLKAENSPLGRVY